MQGELADRWKPAGHSGGSNDVGDELLVLSIGTKVDMRKEMVTAGREPVTADKGAIAQRLVGVRAVPTLRVRVEERNDDVGHFPGKVLWDCLRDGQHLPWQRRSCLMG